MGQLSNELLNELERDVYESSFLDLSGEKLNDDAIAKLVHALKNNKTVTTLWLYDNEITDVGVKDVAQLKLTELNLGKNPFGKAGLEAVFSQSSYEELTLSNNPNVNDETITSLTGNKNLKRLFLDECNLKDKGAEIIGTLKSLERVDVSHNAITDAGAKAIIMLPTLKYANLSYNFVSVDIAKSNKDLKIRVDCSLSYMLGPSAELAKPMPIEAKKKSL